MKEEIDIEQYTYNEVYKTLIAIEGHLENYEDKPFFCASCIFKHLKYLEILSEECLPAKCKLNPLLGEIKKWAINFQDRLFNLSKEEVINRLEQCRDYRKEMESALLFPKRDTTSYGDVHLKEV